MEIGLIGCGNMGQALLKGIISKGYADKRQILVSDKDRWKRAHAQRKLGVRVSVSNVELMKSCRVIILAVKPQDVNAVLGRSVLPLRGKCIISICAGVSTKRLEKQLGPVSVVRVMPNMPGQIAQGVSAISMGRYATKKDRNLAMAIFSCIGEVVQVREQLMDAVTAISGSGPAYFFYLVERLIAAAKKLGLPDQVAKRLAVRTALGSAMLLSQSKQSPQTLRKKVTSKGGTTAAAFTVFQNKGLDKIFTQAFQAAAKRSRELSRG